MTLEEYREKMGLTDTQDARCELSSLVTGLIEMAKESGKLAIFYIAHTKNKVEDERKLNKVLSDKQLRADVLLKQVENIKC